LLALTDKTFSQCSIDGIRPVTNSRVVVTIVGYKISAAVGDVVNLEGEKSVFAVM